MMAGRPLKSEPRGKSPREGQEIGIREIPLGDLWLSVGNITEALSYYKRALSRTADADTEVRVAVARRILECLKRRGKLEDALTFIDSIEPGFEMPARTWLLTEKAKVLCRIGRYGEAASICEKVSKLGSSWENAELYLVMGQVMARTCRWREAITAFEHAAATAAMHGDRGTVGKAFNNLGIAYKNLCRFDESVRYLTKAVEMDRELRDEASLAVKLLNLAITRYKQGDLGATDQAIDECLSLAEQLGMVRIARLAKICKARLELEKGNSECARDLIGEIVSVKEEIDVRTRAIAEEVLADIYAARGATASAIARLKAAIDLAPGEAKDVQAEAMSRLGAVYLQANRLKEAHVWAKRSLEVANRIGDHYEAARSLRTLAGILPGRQGRDALDRAESLFRRMKARLELAITLHERARIRGIETKMAIAYLKRAILLYRSCSALRRRIEALCDLALAYGSLKQFERALTCLAEAEDLSKGCAAMKARVSSARTRIDRQVARSISVRTDLRNPDDGSLLGILRRRLEASGVSVARLDHENGVEIVETAGVSRSVAEAFFDIATGSELNPIVTTNLTSLIAREGCDSEIRLAIAVKLDREPGALVGVFWKGPNPTESGSLISLASRACYEIRRLAPALEEVVRPLQSPSLPICLAGIVTADPKLQRILLSLPKIAKGSANVLIMGETGTGKDLVARAIHQLSERASRPFVAQNCAALPEQLLESELFGHRAGSFTGARESKRGLLEVADGGTFFLDEIGDVSPAIQAKMLRAIETGEIRRVGDTVARPIDIRFISATNKDLQAAIERGLFRRDLYYRLNVVSMHIPPLRERRCDIEILARIFLNRFARKLGKPMKGFTPDAMQYLLSQSWPGNVRQLENEIEKAITIAKRDTFITSDDFRGFTETRPRMSAASLREDLKQLERTRIISILERCNWNKTHAARLMGDISRPALIARMKRLGIPLNPRSRRGQTRANP